MMKEFIRRIAVTQNLGALASRRRVSSLAPGSKVCMGTYSTLRRDARLCAMAMIGAVALLGIAAFAGESALTNSAATPKVAVKSDSLFPDEVVARGKGLEIRRSQLDARVIELKSLSLARGAPPPPELEAQELQRLIGIGLLLAKATDADKTKSQELATKRLETTKSRAGSDEALQRQLKSVGLTEDQYRKQVADETTAETVAEREMKITVSDADVKKFYDENPSFFEQPEMVRVQHLQMNSRDSVTGEELSPEKKAAKRKQMEELLKQARAGEDFAKLMKENTEDPNFKETGGEYRFPRSITGLATGIPSEFEAAAFNQIGRASCRERV